MQIMRATQSFSASVGGAGEGQLFPDSHPLVAAYPQYFEPAVEYVQRLFPDHAGAEKQGRGSGGVESATAEPGEKRSVRPTRLPKRGAAKPAPKSEEGDAS